MNAKVFLAHVIDEALAIGDVDAGIFPDEALHRVRAITEKRLSSLRDEYGHGTETELFMPVGEIKKVIREMLRATGAGLIIMGVHSQNLFERLAEGDPDGSVIRLSTVPVLVVPVVRSKARPQ
jgi:nucleotide-binding universal stress UspA family protein